MATILVVDDLSANREVLVALLRYKGHRLLEAEDGNQGLAVVQAEHPDLVITDVLMPVMDGYEFVRQLRLDPAISATRVVFYTAHYGEREARTLALSTGVSDVLTKPVEPEEVLKVVDRVLSDDVKKTSRDAPPLPTAFDREHLRLLTDKLSDKARDLRTANARLRALINIGLELASETDSERLLLNVCVAARDLFGATYVTLGILDRHDGTLVRVVTDGTDAEWIKVGDSVPGILGTAVSERRTLRGENVGGDPVGLQLPSDHPKIHTFLVAPIASRAHAYGWICLVANEHKAFTEDDEQLVLALAGQVGRIYENEYFFAVAQRERDRAQRYLDTAEVILLALDLNGRVTQINRHACSLLGWTAGEVLGRDWIETCLPARMRDALREKFHNLIGGDVSIVENPILTRSGEERLIEWRNTVLRDDAGNIMGTFSSGTDITERKRAEEEIRHRSQLSALSAAVGLALTNADSLDQALQRCAEALVMHLGAAFARIWTLNEGEGVLELRASAGLYTHLNGPHGKVPLGQFKIGRIAQKCAPHLTNTVIGDPEVNDQEWARREGMVAFAGHPLMVEGRVVGVMGLFARHALSDAVISALASVADHIALGIERHRSADALRTAEERMRFALQNANVGIWDMDYTTGVLRWSETNEAHYGLTPGTFGGTFDAFVELIHPDDRGSVLETVGKAMKAGSDFSILNRAIWPDGSVRWLSGAGRIHLDEHGEPARAVGITQDVTGQKRVEAEVKYLSDEIQRQRMRVFKATMRTVQDIVNNLLNGLQLVQLEAEGEPAEMQSQVDGVIREAATKLKALGDLETIKEKEMAAGLGIDYPGAAF